MLHQIFKSVGGTLTGPGFGTIRHVTRGRFLSMSTFFRTRKMVNDECEELLLVKRFGESFGLQ